MYTIPSLMGLAKAVILSLLVLSACAAPIPEDPGDGNGIALTATATAAASAATAYITGATNDETYVFFPTASDWFTLGVRNAVEWQWDSAKSVWFRVTLSNPSVALLSAPIDLVANVSASMFGFSTLKSLDAALPGSGYVVTLHDAFNSSKIWAVSDSFQLKPTNSTPTLPAPYSVLSRDSTATRRVTIGTAAGLFIVTAFVVSLTV